MRISMVYILFIAIGVACNNKPAELPQVSSNNITVVQNITVKDIVEISNSNPSVKFLDVRTPEETADGVVNGALKIDYRADSFKDELDKLNKETSYIVYCRSGGRSAKAADMMKQMGFKSIYNLEGGYTAITGEEK